VGRALSSCSRRRVIAALAYQGRRWARSTPSPVRRSSRRHSSDRTSTGGTSLTTPVCAVTISLADLLRPDMCPAWRSASRAMARLASRCSAAPSAIDRAMRVNRTSKAACRSCQRKPRCAATSPCRPPNTHLVGLCPDKLQDTGHECAPADSARRTVI
jgi:hypothetical protein